MDSMAAHVPLMGYELPPTLDRTTQKYMLMRRRGARLAAAGWAEADLMLDRPAQFDPPARM